ncbi:signal peptidase II [Buchnera aphidicola]|uniref:Lipoprotein signal peptidase n=1 Tax=Buchnera aphidicola (Sarucallis kahawaluokalani) TaxID=1241878 RepID=A0A4D6YLR7_9GAMM|nr:signal peptidase II [Buchnera aphidicola (Sarucallis kahawaluokalani)]
MLIKTGNIVNFCKNLYITCIIILIDIYSKYLVNHYMKYNEYKKIFTFINLLYVKNYGLLLNIYEKIYQKYQYTILILQLILIIYFIYKTFYTSHYYSYQCILGATISNTVDRLYHGYIIDFIDINFNDYHVIIFNFSDLIFFIGIILRLYQLNVKN